LGPHGNKHFDKLTKTDTIKTLLSKLDVEGAKSIIQYLQNLFEAPLANKIAPSAEQDPKEVKLEQEHTTDTQRVWAVDQLYSLTKLIKDQKEEEWVENIFAFLLFHGCFSVKETDDLKKRSKKEEKVFTPCFSSHLLRWTQRVHGVGNTTEIYPTESGNCATKDFSVCSPTSTLAPRWQLTMKKVGTI
jgi:hypothetical protein